MFDRWGWEFKLLAGTSIALIGLPVYIITIIVVSLASRNILIGLLTGFIEYVVGVIMAALAFGD